MIDPQSDIAAIDEIDTITRNIPGDRPRHASALTAMHVISQVQQRLQYESDQILTRNYKSKAAKQFLSDAAKGVGGAMAKILVAGARASGIASPGIEIRGLDDVVVSRVDFSEVELQTIDELMRSDEKGFSLLDWHLDKIRGPISEVRGAKMAVNIYKAIYPLATSYLEDK